jgi:crotonobetainyl-CoA:carnitine CoA-transferase CaiB-like acyl-CoA transferase
VRVLDLTAFWAGPVATWSLAAFGADVMKLESIQRPDMMRFSSGFVRDTLWEWSPIFHGANSNKRGLTLDLGSPEGIELLMRLVERSDVLVENFSPRVLGNLGVSWERLRERNPRLVLVRMPAFGLDGPWRDRVGFAMTIEQISGLAWRTGHPDGVPAVPRGPCDPLGALHAVFAILLALRQREATGRGQQIEVPLVEPGLNAAAQQVVESTAYGARLGREGNRSVDAAPQGVYRTAGEDAWLALAVASDPQWAALRRALGDPAWAAAAELTTHAGRLAHRDAIDAELRSWLATRDATECAERLLAAGVPAAPVGNPLRVGSNPQALARGFFQELVHPITGRTPYPSFPARFDGAFPRIARPSPSLGQHSDEILAERLGLSPQELAGLRERKVIGTRPAFV